MAKIITSFSHKGGVGKTTLLHNIAVEFANRGKKVLVVDADPQMNLTCAVHGLSTKVIYSNDHNDTWQKRLSEHLSLHDIVSGILGNINSINKSDWYLTSKELFHKDFENGGSLWILSGNVDLSLLEWQLYVESTPSLGRLNLPAMIERDIQRIASNKNIDYILVDTSPSANSLINGSFVMMSDYFFAPVEPNLFSAQAIDSLGQVFNRWRERFGSFFAMNNEGLKLSIKRKFVGIVVNRSKRYRTSEPERNGELFDEDAYTAYVKDWSTQINSRLNASVGLLRQYDASIDEEMFKRYFKDKNSESAKPYIIEGCPDFTGTFRDLSERLGKAVVSIVESEMSAGTNNAPLLCFKESISLITDGLIRLP